VLEAEIQEIVRRGGGEPPTSRVAGLGWSLAGDRSLWQKPVWQIIPKTANEKFEWQIRLKSSWQVCHDDSCVCHDGTRAGALKLLPAGRISMLL
jgi:hypothetical protein